ncbi:MAG: glycerophosphodiester phosphodiesterase [Desulfurococcus sp.]|nr:glycerophosphodiester phosphodiesterase [Desulfurococcus sp.]
MSILEKLNMKPFTVVGHRGAGGIAPENTLKAVEAGVKAGADIVEIDVRATRDGRIVVFHDANLKRLAGVERSIRDVDFEWLRSNVRINGEVIPLLEEVLELVDGRAGVFIEVKEAEATKRTVELIEFYKALSNVAVISFLEEVLVEVRRLNPSVATGLIYYMPLGKITRARELGASIVLPYYRIATARANRLARKLGLKVVAWTINNPSDMVKAYKAGVDGIATDYPDRAVELRRSLTRGL